MVRKRENEFQRVTVNKQGFYHIALDIYSILALKVIIFYCFKFLSRETKPRQYSQTKRFWGLRQKILGFEHILPKIRDIERSLVLNEYYIHTNTRQL